MASSAASNAASSAPVRPDALAITAIGMATPVGLDARASCASLRAGISLMQELEYFTVTNDRFDETPVVGCPVTGVTDGTLGLGRWIKLGACALADLFGPSPPAADSRAPVALFVALPPAGRPGLDARIATELGPRLAERLDAPSLEQGTRCFPDGHAGALKAVLAARESLARREIGRAIVGGIDSLIEPEALAHLRDRKRLKTEEQPDGLIPGEAAAFFEIEPAVEARRRGATVMALIEGGACAVEPVTIEAGPDAASAATGLGQALDGALAGLPERGADTALLIGDLTGESYRGRELGLVVPRVLAHLRARWTLWHAADCIGDTGAAAGAVSVCMAARAFQRGYARAPRALVFGGSDGGLRAALAMRAAPPNPG